MIVIRNPSSADTDSGFQSPVPEIQNLGLGGEIDLLCVSV